MEFPQNIDDEHYMSMGITIHNYLHMNIRKAKKRPAAARLYGAGTHGGVWRGRPQRLSTVPRRWNRRNGGMKNRELNVAT